MTLADKVMSHSARVGVIRLGYAGLPLAVGASQPVAFTTSRDVVGTYSVSLDSLSGTFIVKAPPTPTPTPTPVPAPPVPSGASLLWS